MNLILIPKFIFLRVLFCCVFQCGLYLCQCPSASACAKLAKFDIQSAYRIVPVHPDDRPLLEMAWKEKLYVDTALPFGLRSAPKIFNALADALQWALEQEGTEVIHYLDDFLIIGPPDGQECEAALKRALERCATLGVPIAIQKTEGPVTTLIFLGIELDTIAGTLRSEAGTFTGGDQEVEGEALLHQERVTVPHRPVTARILCSEAREDVPQAHD